VLSVGDGIGIGVGSVIGVGIFRTTGQVLRASGGRWGAVLVWLAFGLLSLVGATVFGRVALRIPEAGGPYAYVREAFGPRAAFVDGWFGATFAVPPRQAAQMLIVGEIFALEVGGSPRVWAFGWLSALFAFHLGGVRMGASLQRLVSTGKIALLLGGVLVALSNMGAHAPPASSAQGAPLGPLPLGVGLAGAFYTYLGWQDVTQLAEELREPARSLRRVLLATVAIVTTAYVAWAASSAFAPGDDPIARSDLPLRDLALARFGPAALSVVSWMMAACILGASAENMLVRPRLWFALARDGLAPRALGRVSATGVPWTALTAQCALVGAFIALAGSFTTLLVVLSIAQALTSTLEALSVVALERRGRTGLPVGAIAFAAANVGLACVLAAQNVEAFLVSLSMAGVLVIAAALLSGTSARSRC
jgi:APA family basic amino acid/polyamine antiporter